MQAVILAGGPPHRLYHQSTGVPKPMAPLFDRPLIEHTIRLLARHGVADIIVCVPQSCSEIVEHVKDGSPWGVGVRYSVENEPRGSAGAVKLVETMLDGTFMVVSGDVITDMDIGMALREHARVSAVASIVLGRVTDASDYGVVECDHEGRVTGFVEKPGSSRADSTTVSAGIYILEPEALASIPCGRACDFGLHLIPRLLSNREPVHGIPAPGYWRNIANVVDYRLAHFDALKGELMLDVPAVRASEGIWVGEAADIHHSVRIHPPVYVGAHARVGEEAEIGGFAVIGAGTVIDERARIERSVLGTGVSVGREARLTNELVGTGGRVVDVDAPIRAQAPSVSPVEL